MGKRKEEKWAISIYRDAQSKNETGKFRIPVTDIDPGNLESLRNELLKMDMSVLYEETSVNRGDCSYCPVFFSSSKAKAMYRKRLPYRNLDAIRGSRKPSITSELHRKINKIFAI